MHTIYMYVCMYDTCMSCTVATVQLSLVCTTVVHVCIKQMFINMYQYMYHTEEVVGIILKTSNLVSELDSHFTATLQMMNHHLKKKHKIYGAWRKSRGLLY